MPEPERAPSRRRNLLIAGALVAVAGAAGLAAVLRPNEAPAGPTPSRAGQAVLPPIDPTAWADVAWTRVDDPVGLRMGPLGQRMDLVVAGGPGFVAAGVTSIGVPGNETNIETTWVSADGERWEPTTFDAGVRPGDLAAISTLAAGPTGVVAWGGVCCVEERPAAWWSSDGARWERRPLPDGFAPDGYVMRVAGGPDGFVAVGINGGAMAIWTSADGRTWAAVEPVAAAGIKGVLTSVERADTGWVAVGTREDRETHDGVVWRSPDLTSWQPIVDGPALAGPEEVELSDIHAFGGGYLLTGSTGRHEDRMRCENLGADGRQIAAAGELAVSCGWGRDAQWSSADGTRWVLLPPTLDERGEPLPPFRPDGRGLMQLGPIQSGGPGLVSLAYDVAGRKGPNDVRGIWTTGDGRAWEPIGVPAQFPPGEFPADMAVVGRRIVAVGSAEARPLPNGLDQGATEDAAAWIGTVLP